MRVFNKYKLFNTSGDPFVAELSWPRKCHLRKVTDYTVKVGTEIFMSSISWETECTTKEYHMMWYAKKSRIRKKYRNRIERRL